MSFISEKIREKIPSDIFTHTEIKNLLSVSPDSRYGLVKRAISNNEIIHLRRGLYALSKKYQRRGINVYELAHKIYSPSYVSLESALSYHGWIPESVPTITSVSMKRSKEFKTPIGVFSYSRISSFNYAGIERIESGKSIFFMAEPTKALVDYILVYKIDWCGTETLVDNLRIEPKNLGMLSKRILTQLVNKYPSQRLKKFMQGLMEDLIL
jgi:predicted transcriptional regulator of viral defense system